MVHIKKLCVGVDSIDQLKEWQKLKGVDRGHGYLTVKHITRAMPKQRSEILKGGSLFWVIKGWILARNPIVGLDAIEDEEGQKKCAIFLRCGPIEVVPFKHRPFQGWRYFQDDETPRDLAFLKKNNKGQISAKMAAELNELGLL